MNTIKHTTTSFLSWFCTELRRKHAEESNGEFGHFEKYYYLKDENKIKGNIASLIDINISKSSKQVTLHHTKTVNMGYKQPDDYEEKLEVFSIPHGTEYIDKIYENIESLIKEHIVFHAHFSSKKNLYLTDEENRKKLVAEVDMLLEDLLVHITNGFVEAKEGKKDIADKFDCLITWDNGDYVLNIEKTDTCEYNISYSNPYMIKGGVNIPMTIDINDSVEQLKSLMIKNIVEVILLN